MTDSQSDRHRQSTGPFVGASLLIHVLGLMLLLWSGALAESERSDDQKERDKPFEVSLVEEEPSPEEREEQRSRETPDQPKPSQPEPRQQTPPPPERRRRKTVQQETNEKEPEDAKFRSEKANRVQEETQARETTQKNVEPDRQQGEAAQQQGEPTPSGRQSDESEESQRKEAAQRQQREARQQERRKAQPEVPKRREPQAEEGQKKVPDSQKEAEEIEKLPMPTVSDYDELNDGSEDREMAKKEREQGAGHGMFERIEKSKGSLKASLENYITEVKPGNHTAVNATADAAATYISKIHRKIHPKWGGEYLPHLDGAYGPGHPLSNSELNTVLELVVDGDSGELKSVNMVRSSGRVEFDAEAISISKMVAPHPSAPSSVVSPDGNVYLHWNFWRDQRQCGTFGVSIYKIDEQGTKEPVREGPADQSSAAQASPK